MSMVRKIRMVTAWVISILLGGGMVMGSFAPPTAAAGVEIDSFHWPAGTFLNFSSLKQAHKDQLLAAVETKVAGFREAGRSMLIKGELLSKIEPETAELNPALVLDQSGLLVMVSNFPNIYYRFTKPEVRLRRPTVFVLKNPKVDRAESILRQAVVVRGGVLWLFRSLSEGPGRFSGEDHGFTWREGGNGGQEKAAGCRPGPRPLTWWQRGYLPEVRGFPTGPDCTSTPESGINKG